MIAFACTSCQKKLSVKDELAGQKVKCPSCGQVVLVPGRVQMPATRAPAVPSEDLPTLPPTAGKAPARAADLPTESASSHSDRTRDPAASEAGHESSLTDFLAPPQQPGELGRLGGYRVLKVLGHGGMGVVFQAEDANLQRLVALKAMLPGLAASASAKERFFREARAAAALKHPHIVTIHQVGEDRGAPFLAMEFLEGEALDVRLKREPRLPLAEVLHLGAQVADALAAAHERGLIHRDIKPANIWLEKVKIQGAAVTSAKILDFGLARALADQTHLTQEGAIIGTPAYMAPEQAGGKAVDHRCDLFSLGCVLYRMTTGQMAFQGPDTIAILTAIALEAPRPPGEMNPAVPQELSDLIMALLAKKAEDRPFSAHDVARALRELQGQGAALAQKMGKSSAGKTLAARPGERGGVAASGKTPTGMSAQAKKRLLLAGAVGLLALLALVGNYVWLHGPTERPAEGPGAPKSPEALPPTFTNTLGIEFVLVPKGKSWLGGGGGKPGDKEVEIVHDFYLGKYEVTQEEWEKVMGENPSTFKAVPGIDKDDQKRFPVEQISWEDAQGFIEQLNKRAKETGWVYRLPTESEWEYACRSGPMKDRSESAFDFYFDQPANQLLPIEANFEHEKGLKRPSKVGMFKPNRLGLCDMHGNVSEMCADKRSVGLRGGAWNSAAAFCKALNRTDVQPGHRSLDFGLRVARVPIGKEIVKTAPEKPAFKNSLGMEFILVPKGKSWLGGAGGKPGDKEVVILHDFYLGRYEVTQEEWERITGTNPSTFKAVAGVAKEDQRRFPVEHVSWEDAQAFIKRLNEHVKETGWVYRLPTQVEWEYACRGGPMKDKFDSAFDFYFEKPTNTLLPDQANFLHDKALERTCKVGSYRPNRLGLYDMHGNVWEWCVDEVKDDKRASRRVFRGGGWHDAAGGCRAVNRGTFPPSHRDSDVGLRLARVPVGKDGK
jgi:formylglycine-generating enzyme required for sulfatase activity/DNA-directed RNA polymerase subunit RPC12/RpoP